MDTPSSVREILKDSTGKAHAWDGTNLTALSDSKDLYNKVFIEGYQDRGNKIGDVEGARNIFGAPSTGVNLNAQQLNNTNRFGNVNDEYGYGTQPEVTAIRNPTQSFNASGANYVAPQQQSTAYNPARPSFTGYNVAPTQSWTPPPIPRDFFNAEQPWSPASTRQQPLGQQPEQAPIRPPINLNPSGATTPAPAFTMASAPNATPTPVSDTQTSGYRYNASAPNGWAIGSNGNFIKVPDGYVRQGDYFVPASGGAQAPIRPPTSTYGQPITLPNGQIISPLDPNYAEYARQMGIAGAPSTSTPNNSSAPTPSIPSTPANVASSSREEQLRALLRQINEGNTPTSDEQGAQAAIDAIIAQQANLAAGTSSGIANLRDQPIAQSFITGQSAAIERQTAARMGELDAMGVPLKTKLAALQAKRSAAADVAKTNLSFETEMSKIAADREAAQSAAQAVASRPVEVGGALIDPSTGRVIYSAPEKTAAPETKELGGLLYERQPNGTWKSVAGSPSAQSGFTLNPGEARYDANGNLIATGPNKTSSETGSNFQLIQDDKGAWFRIDKTTGVASPVSTGGTSGTPTGTGGTTTTNTFNTGTKPTSSAATPSAEALKLQANVTSGLQSLGTLREAEKSALGKFLPFGLERQTLVGNGTYQAAKANLVDVIGRLRSGGAITSDEEKRFSALLPGLTDTDATAKYKLDQVEQFLKSIQAQPKGEQADPLGIMSSANDPLSLGFNSESQTSLNGNADTRINKLASAIAQHETGNRNVAGATGELATRYQFMPATWKTLAQKYLGNGGAPTTDANQDKVAKSYITDLFKQGYDERQIAMIWNGGTPNRKVGTTKTTTGKTINYDTGAYADKVLGIYNKLS